LWGERKRTRRNEGGGGIVSLSPSNSRGGKKRGASLGCAEGGERERGEGPEEKERRKEGEASRRSGRKRGKGGGKGKSRLHERVNRVLEGEGKKKKKSEEPRGNERKEGR